MSRFNGLTQVLSQNRGIIREKSRKRPDNCHLFLLKERYSVIRPKLYRFALLVVCMDSVHNGTETMVTILGHKLREIRLLMPNPSKR